MQTYRGSFNPKFLFKKITLKSILQLDFFRNCALDYNQFTLSCKNFTKVAQGVTENAKFLLQFMTYDQIIEVWNEVNIV